jgi:glycosyltransferase involved in cell wall biosynthesis
MIKLSIVLPCLNEAKSLPDVLDTIHCAAQQLNEEYEIIVADNGSTDGSQSLARAHGAKVVPVAVRGYGSAVQTGLTAATGEVLLFGDADGSYPFNEMAQLIAPILADKADIVVGNRLNLPMPKEAMPALHRYFGTPFLSACIRYLYGIKVYDCNGGMRALAKSAWEKMDLSSLGMEYASEMLLETAKKGLRYQEVNVHFSPAHKNHIPHLRTFRDGFRHLWCIIKNRL